MKSLHPLLFMRNRKEADQLAAMIAAAVYASPAYTDTLQGALALLAQSPFGVLVLDSDVQGGKGITALARLRERYPALPIIVVSSARSEDVAIDAFHLGITDYIPKKRGYGELVVALISQLAAGEPATPRTRLLEVPDNVPLALLRPTYQNRLRVIGYQCEALGLRELVIVEAAEGFVVRAIEAQNQQLAVLEFAAAQFAHLVSDAVHTRGRREQLAPHGLVATGYADLLRAIGHELDRLLARGVTIVELERHLLVCGRQATEGYHESGQDRFEWIMTEAEVQTLLDKAYHRRTSQ